jgi:protein-S-isoprenylcysteine O-methyltransferase Ste14
MRLFLPISAAAGQKNGQFSRKRNVKICSGLFFAVAGSLALGSIRALLRNKTPFDPAEANVKIVRQGPFRLSRNPMYLALLFLLAGVAVFTGSIWMCLALPALLIGLDIGHVFMHFYGPVKMESRLMS